MFVEVRKPTERKNGLPVVSRPGPVDVMTPLVVKGVFARCKDERRGWRLHPQISHLAHHFDAIRVTRVHVPTAGVGDATPISARGLNDRASWVVEASLGKPLEPSLEAGREPLSVGLDSKTVDRGQ